MKINKITIKKVGFHWQAWLIKNKRVVRKGFKRACLIDAMLDGMRLKVCGQKYSPL